MSTISKQGGASYAQQGERSGIYAMPTIEEITNLYLYGQSEKPSSIIRNSIIRGSEEVVLREGLNNSATLRDDVSSVPGRV